MPPILEVRRTIAADFARLLAIKSDPDDVTWSGFACAPDPVRFREWFDHALDDANRLMFTGLVDWQSAGYVHLQRNGSVLESSFGVAAAYRGKGYGRKFEATAIHQAVAAIPGIGRIHAWIAINNVASMRSCTKSRFVPTDQYKEQEFLFPERRVETMRLWVLVP